MLPSRCVIFSDELMCAVLSEKDVSGFFLAGVDGSSGLSGLIKSGEAKWKNGRKNVSVIDCELLMAVEPPDCNRCRGCAIYGDENAFARVKQNRPPFRCLWNS